jgi:peptidoglycan/LPS O-acetylase OafA/YrhL
MTYLKQLDGLRGIAILLVLAAHWLIGLQTYVNLPFGAMGVNLFFVISGFLITRILLNNKDSDKQSTWFSFRQFYMRRILRIFPIYYLTIFIFLAADFSQTKEMIWWLLTYTINIAGCLKLNTGLFGHFWSLAVEEQFYLVFPFFIFFTPRKFIFKGIIAVILLAVLSRILVAVFAADEKDIAVISYHFTPCCFDSLGCGALLAWLNINKHKQLTEVLDKYKIIFFAAFVFFAVGENILMRGFGDLSVRLILLVLERFVFSIICFGVIGKIAVGGFAGIVRTVLENKILSFIGKISYGLYVYHNFMPEILPRQTGLPHFIVYFFAAFAVAFVSWYLIEKPLNNLKRHFEYSK